MLLNGIKLTGYSSTEDDARFELAETTVKDVAALNGQLLTVTDDDGGEMEAFAGYSIACIKVIEETGAIRMLAVKVMDGATAAAIEALGHKVETVASKTDKAAKDAESAKAAARMYVNAQPLTNTQLADVCALIEDFVPGREYAKGLVRRHDGKYYRMAKDIDTQTSKTYQPGTGTESLYTLIDLAPDGIRIWRMPTCAEDSFTLGEKCHYPDADGPVYESLIDANTWSPEAYPAGWSKVE